MPDQSTVSAQDGKLLTPVEVVKYDLEGLYERLSKLEVTVTMLAEAVSRMQVIYSIEHAVWGHGN